MKKDEIGVACSTYGERRGTCRIRLENLRERDHLEDLGVDGRITLKRIFNKWNCGHGVY